MIPNILNLSTIIFVIGWVSSSETNSIDGAATLCLEDGVAAHPTKCDYFYDCWNGNANLGRCPMSMLFNKDKLYCDYPTNVNCGQRKISSGVTEMKDECPYTWGLFPNLEDCSSYYHCSRGRKVNMANCPHGLLFDPDQLTCNWPEKVNCRGAKKPAPMFKCPENDGYFANPDDCKKLYMCQKGQPRMLGCSSGQSYDSDLQRCIPNILGCSHVRSKKEKIRSKIQKDNSRRPDERRRENEPNVSRNKPPFREQNHRKRQ